MNLKTTHESELDRNKISTLTHFRKEENMTNLEKVLSGHCDNIKNYSHNLNDFKRFIQKEVEGIDKKSKEKIDQMEFDELFIALNNKNNIVFKTMIMPESQRKYPYGCMEVMAEMDTIDEKYMACLFFYYIDMDSKNSEIGNKLANAFFKCHKTCNA
jgi:hypothetical protein